MERYKAIKKGDLNKIDCCMGRQAREYCLEVELASDSESEPVRWAPTLDWTDIDREDARVHVR